MEGDNRLRLIIAGLVLAAFAIGYFLLSQRFQSNKTTTVQASPSTQSNVVSQVSPSPSLVVLNQASPSPVPGNNTPGPVAQTLPRTGFPLFLAVAITGSVMVSGFFLRKFPD